MRKYNTEFQAEEPEVPEQNNVNPDPQSSTKEEKGVIFHNKMVEGLKWIF